MTPVEGEVIADLTNDELRLGDGLKAGGWRQASAAAVQKQLFNYAAAGGSANAITLTPAQALAGYVTGCSFEFRATADNTGATTIAISGLAAIAINKVSAGVLTALAAGDIKNGLTYRITYNGSVFQLIGAGGGVTSIATGDGLTGGPITATGTVAMNTNNAMGVGSYCILANEGGGNIASGSTLSGSTLRIYNLNQTGTSIAATSVSGTWRNMSGVTIIGSGTTNRAGIWIRVA